MALAWVPIREDAFLAAVNKRLRVEKLMTAFFELSEKK